jgi:hypothetical protein
MNWLRYDLIVGAFQIKDNSSFYNSVEAGEYKKNNLYEIKVDTQ